MDLLAISLSWPLPVRLSWASTATPNPGPGQARGRAFLLRGNGIFFSRGLGVLCDDLRQAGIWTEDLRCVGGDWVCQHLRQEKQTSRLRGPIVLVGHSRGGRAILHAAGQLQADGIGVDLVVCLDVALPPPVPPGVRRAVNLYLTHPRLYPARPLVAAPDCHAVLENIDLDAANSPIPGADLTHLNLTDSPAVQAFVLQLILETMHSSEKQSK